MANHHIQDITSLGSKGHADPYFMSPLNGQMGNNTIETDRGEQERHSAEHQQQHYGESGLIERSGDALVHRLDVIDRLVGINDMDLVGDRGDDA
jgi:hypothetical protein